MIKFAPVNANGALIVSSNRVTQITNSNVISSWYYYDTNLKFDVSYHKNLPENENKNWTIISEFPLVANIVTNLRNIDLVETQKVNEYGNLFLSYNKNTSTTLDMITSNSVTPIGVNFISQSPESVYNWEIFLHVALKIAREFSTRQRLDEARKWYHLVFDPTTNDQETGSQRFWNFPPFRNENTPHRVEELLNMLAKPDLETDDNKGKEIVAARTKVQDQITAWLENPFNPFAVARMRIGAFEWFTVTRYIKNLIAW